MGTKYKKLEQSHLDFIKQQKIFFVATANENGRVNLSPKGYDSFVVVDTSLAMFLNKTGSGNESAAHIQNKSRITIMFCSFEKKPIILRIYGKAIEVRQSSANWDSLITNFNDTKGVRQIFAIDIELVQTSCGFGVPFFKYIGNRDTLNKWADNKGQKGLKAYSKDKNTTSLDGKKIIIE